MLPLSVATVFITAFLITFLITPLALRGSYFFGFVDIPDGLVKKHKSPIPYLGGSVVYIGFFMSFILNVTLEYNICIFIFGITLLFILGLIDDIIALKPYQKFFGQMMISLCFLKAGLYLKSSFFSCIWTILFSWLWILSIINAFNLIDVMDGLATLTAGIATVSFFIIAYFFKGNVEIIFLLSALLGSLCAFFIYNRPNACIYLGDAGSLFLGGTLAIVPFWIEWGHYTSFGFLAPLFILAVPLFELIFLIVVRSLKGIPFYRATPDHCALYLQSYGWSKNGILSIVASVGLINLVLIFLFVYGSISYLTLFFVECILLGVVLGLLRNAQIQLSYFGIKHSS